MDLVIYHPVLRFRVVFHCIFIGYRFAVIREVGCFVVVVLLGVTVTALFSSASILAPADVIAVTVVVDDLMLAMVATMVNYH